MWNELLDLCPIYCSIVWRIQEVFIHSPLWSLSAEEVTFTGPRSLGWTDLSPLKGGSMWVQKKGRTFFSKWIIWDLSQGCPWGQTCFLCTQVTYKHRLRAAGPDDTLMHYGASSLPWKKAMQMGGWQDAGHAMFIATLGERSVREMASLVRGNYRDELHCPGP